MKLHSVSVMEGAGVKLNRVFAHSEVKELDPFLLLDHFKSDNPADYVLGFPWHPHRGIETVTYLITGEVEHQDSLGNKGVISSGDVQWMTAGSGIIHQEMPKKYSGTLQGFQLWVNLPKKHKMMKPRYRGITAKEIPRIDGVKVIAGTYKGVEGPVQDLMVDVTYLDVTCNKSVKTKIRNGFVYLFEGKGVFNGTELEEQELITVEKELVVEGDCRFLLVEGEPLNEPIAWGGPIVMNTEEELSQAFKDYQEGTFIK